LPGLFPAKIVISIIERICPRYRPRIFFGCSQKQKARKNWFSGLKFGGGGGS